MIYSRKEIIENMIKILEKFKELPMFKLEYVLLADNDKIEKYIKDTTPITDWFGNDFTPEEIRCMIDDSIKAFHNSAAYNPNGKSERIFDSLFKINDVTFDNIREIMEQCPIEGGEFVKFLNI